MRSGPIPVILDRADDLGIRSPSPSRVKATRAAAAERLERTLDRLADDPPGSDDALMAALAKRGRWLPAVAGRLNGA